VSRPAQLTTAARAEAAQAVRWLARTPASLCTSGAHLTRGGQAVDTSVCTYALTFTLSGAGRAQGQKDTFRWICLPGLTLTEAKAVLAGLQRHLVQAQAEEHCQTRRRCSHCALHAAI
jgi:hypothetical protein